ncbi:mitochondrial import receptor subunit TOM70 [Fopius arisanus]|uniref:Mitochondrial import receptor subunit TOM70 n=4 Tax=Fopius arisanus TaxID=64838 RepID=A0A9R1UBP4_9HYME|nr:PREDICTED: mitochondrial import receptor subunit TOM70 [Fopius arisanus]
MPVSNSAASAVSSSLPKWQLALAVGAPVALGLGYIYYKNSSQGKPKGPDKSNGTAPEKQISIDGDSPGKNIRSDRPETPAAKAQRYKTLGNEVFRVGKYDDAILYYNKAIEACPLEDKNELATFYQNRAAAYDALEKFTAVKDDCTKALELNPKYTKALIRRAKVLEKINELELALEDITAACILEKFTNSSALLAADRVLRQLGKQHAQELLTTKKPVMPSKHFIKTYFSSFRNDPLLSAEAINLLDNHGSPGLTNAVEAFRGERYDDIIPICTAEIEKSDTSLSDKMQLLLLRGTFYLLLGQPDKAIGDLNAVISNESASKEVRVNALIKRATMHMQLENSSQCLKDFEKAVEIYPNCGDIYHHRGQVNLLLEKVNEAREDSEKSLKLNPEFGIAYAQKCYTDYRHAALSRMPNLLESAMENFEKSFELFPDCCECYTLYAQMLCDAQSYEKADEYFSKAIEKDPKNATIYVHRGLLQLQWCGNVIKAMEYINKALELDDKCEFGYETLGTIEVQRGNLKEAIKLFDKALSLARTALELTHIFSLQDAAKAQLKIGERLGADFIFGIPNMS